MAIRSDIGVDPFEAEVLFSGEDRTVRFIVLDADGAAQNVTGWAMSFVVGSWLTLTTGAGVTLTTPASGIVDVSLSAANLAMLSGKSLHYKLRRTDAGSNTVMAYGTLSVRP